MDGDVSRKLNDLIRALCSSEECREYQAAKRELDQFPEKAAMAHDFRRRNFIYQTSDAAGHFEAANERVELHRIREELRRDPVIDRYLTAELVLCRTLRQVSLEILNIEDLALESMEDIL